MRYLTSACLLTLTLSGCSDDPQVSTDTTADTADTATEDTADMADTVTADTVADDDTSVVEDVSADTTAQPSWSAPSCDEVVGLKGLAFSTDGSTFVLPEASEAPMGEVDSIAVTDVPGLMYLSQKEAIFRSTDGGCSWSTLDGVTGRHYLTPSVGGVVYGTWPGDKLLEIQGTTVKPINVSISIAALGVDRDEPAVLLAATTKAGVVYRSTNGGVSFSKVGDGFEHHISVEGYIFDPNDVNHIVLGVGRTAFWTTFDGGFTWTNATGFAPGGYVNSFNEALSPVDGNIVWSNGISIDENDAGASSEGRHIYRSTDGGLTFAPVLDHTSAKPLNTNMPMTVHPSDPNVVYFVQNGWSDDDAEIRRFDLATETEEVIIPNVSYITAFAWAPSDPPTLYVGYTR